MTATITNNDRAETLAENEMSPQEIAEAAFSQAMTGREFQTTQQEATHEAVIDTAATGESTHRKKRSHFVDERSNASNGAEDTAELRGLWAPSTTDSLWKQTEAVEKTMAMVHGQIESVIRQGLEAFHARESVSRELVHAKEDIESKDRDLKRLRFSEEQSRTTVSNLLRALETAKSDARDASRSVQMEARLRAELSFMRSERDEALSVASECNRKVQLLDDELRSTKAKLLRTSQEKAKTERDSRAAIQLARSLENNSSNDDYYRHKVTELTNQLESHKALFIEQQREMDDMRRQAERSMSQNRLAKLRAEGAKRFNPCHST